MADCVGPAVQSVQGAAGKPPLDRSPPDPEPIELPARNDAVLTTCDLGEQLVGLFQPPP
jgi:hypothetical protein